MDKLTTKGKFMVILLKRTIVKSTHYTFISKLVLPNMKRSTTVHKYK